MATSSSRQNSRFSSLNVFKFTATSKPPPPPPKDSYRLANPSLTSLPQTLSPDSLPSNPRTPNSAGYATGARSPSPSPSFTPSITPSTTGASTLYAAGPSTASLTSDSVGSKKGFFRSLGKSKKSKTPKSPPSVLLDEMPSETVDDPGISLPWNFQHNVHVDEAFAGLPPTWSASLSAMGFSEEEIAAIHARRAASRKPSLYALGTNHTSPSPESPSSTHSTIPHPAPQTSSLRRDADAVSQHSHTSYAADISRNLSTDYSDFSMSSMQSDHTASLYITGRPTVRSPDMMSQHSRQMTPSPPPQHRAGPSHNAPPLKDSRPRTPTKRGYHVANDSLSTISSPPPAYKSPKKEPMTIPIEEEFTLPPSVATATDTTLVDSTFSTDVMESDGEPHEALHFPLPTNRLSTRPPRLSLHQDGTNDLSKWTESLFSIIPSDNPDGLGSLGLGNILSSIGSTSSPSASARIRRKRASVVPPHTVSHNRNLSASTRQCQLPLQKSLPILPAEGALTPPSSPGLPPIPGSASSNPLWQEVYDMVQPPNSSSTTSSTSPSPLFSPLAGSSIMSPTTTTTTCEECKEESSELQVSFTKDKENRDSSVSTMTVTPATIIRHVSIAKRARANVIQSPVRDNSEQVPALPLVPPKRDESDDKESTRSETPSSESHSSGSAESVSPSLASITTRSSSAPCTKPSQPGEERKQNGMGINTGPYVETSPQPSPRAGQFDRVDIITPALVRKYKDSEEERALAQRPSIVIDEISVPSDKQHSVWSAPSSAVPSPLTPAPPRYPGWVSEVVAPLKDFIDEKSDPRELYTDLREVAEGESGSVFAATVIGGNSRGNPKLIAIKHVVLLPSGSQKLFDLEKELTLMKRVRHPQILAMETLYIDLVDDSLWITMELMDRSLADVLGLADQGVILTETHLAQFASDVLAALSHLQIHGIAHRDLRSDNLLVNENGAVKLADFSNAVQVNKARPKLTEPAGVIFWQAPEMRKGSYNALKVDVFSLGATMWEMAQGEPPFADAADASELSDRWPPLDQSESYSRSFHEFLNLCSEPSDLRPNPDVLLHTPFIRGANGRSAVVTLLAQCRSIEENISRRQSTASEGTVSLS